MFANMLKDLWQGFHFLFDGSIGFIFIVTEMVYFSTPIITCEKLRFYDSMFLHCNSALFNLNL